MYGLYIFNIFEKSSVLQFHEGSIFSTLPSHHFLVPAILTSVKGTLLISQYIFVIAETSLPFMPPALGQPGQLTCYFQSWFLFLQRPCGLTKKESNLLRPLSFLLQSPLPVCGLARELQLHSPVHLATSRDFRF